MPAQNLRSPGGPPPSGAQLIVPLAAIVLIVAVLEFAREVLIPIVLAVILSFVLTPPMLKLRTWGLPRRAAVFSVVAIAFLIIVGVGALLTRQVTELAGTLPNYQYTLRQKLRELQPDFSSTGILKRAAEAVESLGKEIGNSNSPESTGAKTGSEQRPIQVEVHSPPARPLDYMRDYLTPLLGPLANAGLVLVLVIFILLQREDLRDRLIRVVGGQDLERTTTAINDAAYRLSRLFLTSTIMNASYGAFIALALWVIGVPTSALWGIIAGLMRFVPYVGSVIAAGVPVIVAAAVHPDWSVAIMTLGLFIVTETLMGQFLEPWLLGRATGLSPLATIVALSFWAWLWGPIGLVLAIPLTVCLTVLGRHVERMRFLYVLLGDEPALSAELKFYQRLLAGDSAELALSAEQHLKNSTLLDYLDSVAVPALILAATDHRSGKLSQERLTEMGEVLDELIEELAEASSENDHADRAHSKQNDGEEATGSAEHAGSERAASQEIPPLGRLRPDWRGADPVLCIGLRTPLDRAVAAMLALVAQQHGIDCKAAGAEDVTLAGLGRLDLEPVQLAVISLLDGEASPAYARYFARRLKRKKPELELVFGFWGARTPRAVAVDVRGGAPSEAKSVGTLRAALCTLITAASEPTAEVSEREMVEMAK